MSCYTYKNGELRRLGEMLIKDENIDVRTEQEKLFEEILTEMLDTYKAKNHDYGNSFTELYKEYGMTSVVIRLSDKLNRLKTLTKQEAQVKDEKIEDTLKDLANYAVLAVMELRKGDK